MPKRRRGRIVQTKMSKSTTKKKGKRKSLFFSPRLRFRMSFNSPRFENILFHSLFSRQKYVSPFKFGENSHSSMLFLQLLVVSKHKKKISAAFSIISNTNLTVETHFCFHIGGFTFTGLSFIWRNVSVLLHFWRGDPMSNQSFTFWKICRGLSRGEFCFS